MNARYRFPGLLLALVIALPCALAPQPAAAAENPDSAQTQLAFGVKMAKRGLWQEALFRFKQADRLEPNNSKTLNNVAVAYEALGLFDQALEVYQEAVKIDAGNTDLRQNYARFVDFYRNFRPDPADGEAAAENGEPEGEAAGS